MTCIARTGQRALLALIFGLATVAALFGQDITAPSELVTYPDLILYNGRIVSMDDASLNDSAGKTFQAMAIRGERIMFLGTDQQMLRLAGPKTQKFDLKGHLVTPGLINTHTHLHDAAVNSWAKKNPDKVEAVRKMFSVTGKTNEEITRGIELVIKENMAHPLDGQWAWIDLPTGQSGSGIGIDYLTKNVMDRGQLDKLAPKLPVFIGAHPKFLWNSAARNAFLDWYEVEPTDENESKAITIDTTMGRSLIADFYFDKHMDELADVLENYLRYQTIGGFTTFSSHIVGLRKMPAYQILNKQGRMPLRFGFSNRYCQQVEVDIPGCFLRAGDYAGLGNNSFWNVGLTLGGIDNGPPAICTTMEAPKEWKDKEECIIQPGNDYYKAVYSAIRSRYRYVVNHSWGDKGIDYVMDAMDQIMKENSSFDLKFIQSQRYSSDHCGFYPTPSQLPRMQKFGWYISCDPRALTRSAPWLQIYGNDNAKRIAPIKSSIKFGVVPSLESENGYDPYEAGKAIRPHFLDAMAFITRKNAWGDSIAPEEAIDRSTLMKMATTWASRYVLREKEIGSLEPGKLADYVIWNKDYFSVPENEIGTVIALQTVLGGKTMMLRDEYAKTFNAQAIGPQARWTYTVPKPPATDLKKLAEGAGE